MVLANTSELASVERKAPMVDLSIYSIVTDFIALHATEQIPGRWRTGGGACV